MITTVSLAPRNSVVLIMGAEGARIPDSMGGKLVVATTSCIAVGTRNEADGKTSITLTDETQAGYHSDDRRFQKVFSGVLETPERQLAVRTVLLQTVARLEVSKDLTRIVIFTNDESEPDKICIVASPQNDQQA